MEGQALIITAVSIAFIHTLVGPDHYLPFAAIAKARRWTLSRTLTVTAVCGLGHLVGSVLLGLLGIALGAQLTSLVAVEEVRGALAGWALIGFGLVYAVWGWRRAQRAHPHVHRHGNLVHRHPHNADHGQQVNPSHVMGLTPWTLFIVFVLGPCEALIPLLMYPAAQHNTGLVLLVAGSFGVVTVLTMLAAVAFSYVGLTKIRAGGRFQTLGRYGHAIAGSAILACGSAIQLLGV